SAMMRSGLTGVDHAASRKRWKPIDLNLAAMIVYAQTNLGPRRDGPKIGRLERSAEFIVWMVLRKAAVILRMRTAFRTSPQVGNQLLQLRHTSFYHDGDKKLSRQRVDQDIRAMSRHATLPRFHTNLAPQPATVQNQGRSSRQLTNSFAKKTRQWGIMPEDPAHLLAFLIRSSEQLAFDMTRFAGAKESFFQA